VAFSDGERITLRRPTLSYRNLAYGPLGLETKTSLRNAPPVFGLGLLESVSDAEIFTGRGRPNFVFNFETRRKSLGRFGLKANQPNLKQQIANAFMEDIGVTSSLFPAENCAATPGQCRSGASKPELADAQLDAVVTYISALAPPARRNLEDRPVKDGELLFRAIGCSECHRDTLHVAEFSLQPALNGVAIHPYTDLLLHDMGEGLADNRPEGVADGREWRTAPLWGIGLTKLVSGHTLFLHDGRARNVEEAILWHGGEGQAARDGYAALSKADREALIRFVESL
jgi:CxxC motif-containing protein (DUF1111 family)